MNKKTIIIMILITFLASNITLPIGMSLKLEIKEHIMNNTYIAQSVDNLPSYFSWRDISGIDFVTSIRNQSPYSSCESFAIVAAIETMIQYKMGKPYGCDLSEAHLWFNSEPSLEWGSYPDKNLKYLKEHGIPDEACWPYPKDREMHYPNETCPCWELRAVKISDWSYLPDDQIAIKNALMIYGPVPTYMFIYNDFFFHRKGIYVHRWGKAIAPHM
jgi:hypothetical protein